MDVYSFGYHGQSPDRLKQVAEALNAKVVDIRFTPRSRDARWNKSALEKLLGWRYQHIQALGNANYKGGPIKLLNPVRGIAELMEVESEQQPPEPGKTMYFPKWDAVILMCVCKNFMECHRHEVINEVQNSMGADVYEGELVESDAWKGTSVEDKPAAKPNQPSLV